MRRADGSIDFDKVLTEERKRADRFPTSPGKRMPVVDRTKVPAELVAAAEGMESMFINEMTRVMRQSIPRNELDLESPASEIYRGMLDTELSAQAARRGGVGLADQIIAYIQPASYTLGSTGGTPDENRQSGRDK